MDSKQILGVALLSILVSEWTAPQFSCAISAGELFDKTESDLLSLVKQVEENDLNKCALLSTCNDAGSCSRYNCYYDANDLEDYDCQHVHTNKYCASNKSECKRRNMNFKKSFVSASETTDISNSETTVGICAQRMLDELFKNVSNPTTNTQVFFGAVDGTTRIYPGRDELCQEYEPRVRPWYLLSLYIKKVVMVVIDNGFSMARVPVIAGVDKSQTPLSTAQNITKALMNTLSDADYINIMVYNASDASLLAPSPVPVNDLNSDTYPPVHPEFNELTTKMMNSPVGAANSGPSNLTFAMEKAVSNLARLKPEFAKIVIVLTDGALGDAATILKAAGVKTFMYKFGDFEAADKEQLCSVGGSYEVFPTHRRKNPLFALISYFSFIANAHRRMNDSVVYGNEYRDFIQADSNIFTISHPAYDPNRVLLGVVGIDIHKSDLQLRLGITDHDFETELLPRRVPNTFNASRDLVLGSASCINLTSSSISCGADAPVIPNGGLCEANFAQTRGLAQFSCCGDCKATASPANKSKAVSLGIGVGVPSFIILALVAIILGKTKCVQLAKKMQSPTFNPVFKGDDVNSDPVQHKGRVKDPQLSA